MGRQNIEWASRKTGLLLIGTALLARAGAGAAHAEADPEPGRIHAAIVQGGTPAPIGGRPLNWPACTMLGSSINWGSFSGNFEFYFPLAISSDAVLTQLVVESAAGTGSASVTIHVAVYTHAAGPGSRVTTGSLSGVNGQLAGTHVVDVTDALLPVGDYWIGVAVFGGMFTPTCRDTGLENFYFGNQTFNAATNPFTASPPGTVSGPNSSGANNWGKAYVSARGLPAFTGFANGFE